MTIASRRILMILAAAVLLPCLAQTARADSVVKFSCGIIDSCTGGPITGPPFYSIAPIGGFTTSLLPAEMFSFSFDTRIPTSALLTDGYDTLTGTIVSGSVTNGVPDAGSGLDTVTFNVLWDLTKAPYVFQSNPSFGSGPSMVQFGTVTNGVGGVPSIATITVSSASPVPEPGSIALLGTGLLLCGRLLRKKKEEGAEAAT